ncbi:hypothetical protein Ddc_18666 [Ditylenchus destructor]|nr:hypothetical protein Ddc_18666 [Ditylenchus destructor]
MLVHVPRRRYYRRPVIVALSLVFFGLFLIVLNQINRSNTNKSSVAICSKMTSSDTLTLLNDSYRQSANDIYAQLCDLRQKPNAENFTSNIGSPLVECGIVPPLYPFEKRFRTVPRLKINICAIEKTGEGSSQRSTKGSASVSLWHSGHRQQRFNCLDNGLDEAHEA